MPELPDIEGFRRLLDNRARGRTIQRVEVRNTTVLRACDASELERSLRGRQFGTSTRHGKWLFVATDGPTIAVHCAMTGRLRWASPDTPADAIDRVVIDLDGGRLIYSDRRNLGTIALVAGDDERAALTGPLGPDALGTSVDELGRILHGSRRNLKATLIDQSAIAGLGNMLSDEIAWRARLDLARPARSVGGDELVNLHRTMRDVLRRAVRAGHIPRTPTWLSSQRDADDPVCPRCHSALHRRSLNGRTSLWCEHCQGASTDTR